jgi:hypothetical protein
MSATLHSARIDKQSAANEGICLNPPEGTRIAAQSLKGRKYSVALERLGETQIEN